MTPTEESFLPPTASTSIAGIDTPISKDGEPVDADTLRAELSALSMHPSPGDGANTARGSEGSQHPSPSSGGTVKGDNSMLKPNEYSQFKHSISGLNSSARPHEADTNVGDAVTRIDTDGNHSDGTQAGTQGIPLALRGARTDTTTDKTPEEDVAMSVLGQWQRAKDIKSDDPSAKVEEFTRHEETRKRIDGTFGSTDLADPEVAPHGTIEDDGWLGLERRDQDPLAFMQIYGGL